MTSENQVYDHIFVGTGLASVFAAYSTLKLARAENKPMDILVIGDQVAAPCSAGSHWVLQAEGMMSDQDIPRLEDLKTLLRVDGRDALLATIRDEKIDCDLVAGYEIKARSKEELDAFIAQASQKGVFTIDEISYNGGNQTFNLPGYEHSISVSSIGQMNTPKLVRGLIDAIEHMGGTIVTGVTYKNHALEPDGRFSIQTSRGAYHSAHKPFLATGALDLAARPDFPVPSKISYTGALVIGPLDEADARKISKGPMAICDLNVQDDVFWGGIDPNNKLTIGQGELASTDEAGELKDRLAKIAENILPGITEKYPHVLHVGPMMMTPNTMPVIGRTPTYDVATGWAGLGIVPGYLAAQAFAHWYVNEDDSRLKLLESLHPQAFTPATPARSAGGPPSP